MNRRWNVRSLFDRRRSVWTGAGRDSCRAGRLVGASGQDEAFEALEQRVLLAGDHPSLVDFPTATDLDPFSNGRTSAQGEISVLGDGSLDPGDLFRFTAPSDDFVRVLADAQNLASPLDTKITVFKEENGGLTPLGTSSGNSVLTAGTPTDAWFGFVAEQGVNYLVHVFSETQDVADPTATGQYTLRVRTGSQQLVYDPNTDTIGLPPIDPMTGPAPIEGSLGADDPSTPAANDEFSQDDIFFRFTTPDTEEFDSLMAIGARPLMGSADLDTRLDIYNAQGELVASDSQSNFETAAFTTLRSSPDSEFFFRIRSDEFQDPASVPSAGDFGLKVIGSANEVELDPVRRDAVDGGALFFSHDFDLRRFTAVTTGEAFVTATSAAAPFDIRLTLFNDAGEQVAFADDFNGLNAEIQTILEGGEDFFLLIDSFDDAQVNGVPPGDAFTLVIEAAHVFDEPTDGDVFVDDHQDTPTDVGNLDDLTDAELRELRRQFENATPLVFEDPVPLFDADGNLIRDQGPSTVASSDGRIFRAGDTDLFQFVPPVDLLSEFEGNNDDVGTSLFVGGSFTGAEQNTAFPVNSDALAIWDAADWWVVGDQRIIEDPAGNPVQLGFVDNPNTTDTNGPQVLAMHEVTLNGAPALVVGGDFQLNVPNPAAPPVPPFFTFTNLAVWAFNPQLGRYAWNSLGDVNGPVRALETFDPEQFQDIGAADPAGPQLVVGGSFSNAGGQAATNLATFDLNAGAWQAFAAPGIAGNGVFALDTFDPRDPGDEREADPDQGLDAVPDTLDQPLSLIIGGDFTGASGDNIAFWNGHDGTAQPLTIGFFRPGGLNGGPQGTDGPVHALTVFDPPDDDNDDVTDFGPRLIIGGDFTTAGGIAANNIVAFGAVDGTQDEQDPNFAPQLLYLPIGGGVTNPGADSAVFALDVYTPPELPTGFDPHGVLGLTAGLENEILVIGGEFTAAGGVAASNVALFDGAPGGGVFAPMANPASQTGEGFSDPVRALEVMVDEQEPQIGSFDDVAGPPRQVIFAGGDFLGGTAMFDVEVALGIPFFQFEGNGANGLDVDPMGDGFSVFALSAFDDQNPAFDNSGLFYDRHDKPGPRPQLVVSPGPGSFVNTAIRVFDSNFNEVYSIANGDPGADTISPPFPDPSGMLDPSLPGVNEQTFNDAFRGIDLFAGEVYFIEVSSLSSTGLFNLSLRIDGLFGTDLDADGLVPDLTVDPSEPDYGTVAPFTSDVFGRTMPASPDGTGVFAGPNDTRFEVQDGERFGLSGAPAQTLDQSGDAATEFNLAPQGLQGNQIRISKPSPSLGGAIGEEGNLGMISSINDADVFQFTAPSTGVLELRVVTLGLADEFRETTGTVKTKTFDSPLDAAIRVFNNDFEQIAYNNDNTTVVGDRQELPFTGTFPFTSQLASLEFTQRDPRVLLPVIEGEVYFVQVESGQRFIEGSSPVFADRTLNTPETIDWRRVTGSFDLLINAPNTQTLLGPGDDHIDNSLGQGTPIPIRDDGTSSLNLFVSDNDTPLTPGDDFFFDGTINQPQDVDQFELIAPVSGTMTVRVERANTSGGLLPAFTVSEVQPGGPVVAGTGLPNSQGIAQAQVTVQRGSIYSISVQSSGGTTGQFRISVSGLEFTDDHADRHRIPDATPIELLDFLGAGEITGSIESPGDTDLFRFTPTGTQEITVSAESAGSQLNARITVFEITEDSSLASANPLLARIGESIIGPDSPADAETVVSVNTDRLSPRSGEEFPTFYILVQGISPVNDSGAYTLRLDFAPTDDHADLADLATQPGNASTIVIDQSTGQGSIDGNIELAEDTDLFTFVAPAGGVMNINPFATSSLDADVQVFDSSGTLIASSGGDVNITVVRNQRYFVAVLPNPAAAPTAQSGTYQLVLQGPANDDHPNETEFDIASVITLDPQTGDGMVGTGVPGENNPRISPSSDSDLFRFTTLADTVSGEPLTITVDALPQGAAISLAPRITVFDAQQNVIADQSISTPGGSLTVDLGDAVSGGTTFFVLVQDQGLFGAPQTNNEFKLTIDGPPGEASPPDDPSDIDFQNPRVISLNSLGDRDTTDQIETANDRDLFRFTALADGETFVQVVTPTGSILNASVTVLDAPSEDPSNVVATDSNGIPGVTANTSFQAQAGQDFFVIVDGIGAGIGSYTLRIDGVGNQVITQIPEVDQLGFNNRLFFPEGFASAQTSEFVSIANPNDFDVRYSLVLRFETGERDVVIANNVLIEAGSRGGQTLSRLGDITEGVRPNTPFAIEIVSDGVLGATLSRFDFSTSQGETFTTQTARQWTFGRVEREPGVRDFIVMFNPADFAVDVTLSATLANGSTVQTTKRVEGLRRSGFAIDQLQNFPQGVFGATLTATPVNPANDAAFDGVVASISHFDVAEAKGFGLLGDPLGGALAGSINNITQGTESQAEVVLFNPGSSTASVELTGRFIRADLPEIARNIDIPARGTVVLNGAQLGLIQNQPAGFFYESDVPVSVVFSEDRPTDSNGQAANTLVGTNFFFGDAFIRRNLAGELYFETLSLFNPSGSAIDIQVEFFYVNGNSETFNFNVDGRDFEEFVIHENEQFLAPTTPDGQSKTAAFSIQVTSSSPFSTSLNHFDLFFGSGWGASGANLGLVNPVSTIL